MAEAFCCKRKKASSLVDQQHFEWLGQSAGQSGIGVMESQCVIDFEAFRHIRSDNLDELASSSASSLSLKIRHHELHHA